MKTVIMAIAVVKDGDSILLRKMDPARNPYQEPWALFGGRIEGDGSVEELLNVELVSRWDMHVSIGERLWWDEEQKEDHDGETKRFIYLDALCTVESGSLQPSNQNESLEWVSIADLNGYDINPPSRIVLERLRYLSSS